MSNVTLTLGAQDQLVITLTDAEELARHGFFKRHDAPRMVVEMSAEMWRQLLIDRRNRVRQPTARAPGVEDNACRPPSHHATRGVA